MYALFYAGEWSPDLKRRDSDRLWKLRGRIIQLQAKGGDRYELLPVVTSQATPPECTKRADIHVDGAVANLKCKPPDEHDGNCSFRFREAAPWHGRPLVG